MLPNAKEIADQELTLCHSDHGALLRERLERVTWIAASSKRVTKSPSPFSWCVTGTREPIYASWRRPSTEAVVAELGHTGSKLIIKFDQESPRKARAATIASGRCEQALLEHSHHLIVLCSNGVDERGIKEVEYQVRVLMSGLHPRFGMDLGISAHILPVRDGVCIGAH